MIPAANARVPSLQPDWLARVRRELASFPGRKQMTIRLVVTVAVVTVISMALQVPQLAFSAFFVFFVTKENRALTLLTGVLMILGTTIATAVSLILFHYTFDYPELRFPVLAALIFSGMFLSRTFVIGPLGFSIGFFTALMQTIAESAPNTDALVRGELWLWIAIVYPITITIVINQFLLPADPWPTLAKALAQRLDTAAIALERVIKEGAVGGQNNPALLEQATRGSAGLRALLNFAETKDPQLKQRHASLIAVIAASEHLLHATAALEFRQFQSLLPDDLLCAKKLLLEIAQLKAVLPEHNPILSPRKVPVPQATQPQLSELQFAIESFRDGLIRGVADNPPPAGAQVRKPLFIADAFTNFAHLRFSLKVTLAAMTCYLIYTGLNWPGISTAFVTCCFIALENTGATIRKGWLRLIGCATGGFFGYLAIIFLIPHMESITSLLLLTIIGSALAGWVAAGTDRISYAGLQAAFAFYMCIFQGFAPDTNFTIVRDRLLGILLGITVSSIVFRYIWQEHAIDGLRTALARVLRNLSQLLFIPQTGATSETEKQIVFELRDAITKDLDNTLRLSEVVVLEKVVVRNSNELSPPLLEHITAHTQALCLISANLLGKTKLEEWQRLDQPTQQTESVLRTNLAEQLQHVADFVETGQPSKISNLEPALTAWNQAAAQIKENDRPRLVRRLVEQIRHLIT